MLLHELLQYTFSNISLYIEKAIGEYETVFTGNKKDIPEKYLYMNVSGFFASKNDLIEIEIY